MITWLGMTAAAACVSTRNYVQAFSMQQQRAAPAHGTRSVPLFAVVSIEDGQRNHSSLEQTPTTTPFLTLTRRYERIADQILDVVLLDLDEISDEQLPEQMALWCGSAALTKKQAMQQKKWMQEQQVLWIEQLSKIMAASGKTLWSQARMRSGVLPSGRTVLGTIVDPLGIFVKETSTSPKVQSQRPLKEDQSVVLTRRLVELIHQSKLSSENHPLQAVATDLPAPSELTRPQLMAFSRILSAKIWDRRVTLVRASNRFWKQMVSLQAARSTKRLAVASGERLLQSIPQRAGEICDVDGDCVEETERLQAARHFLEYYQSEEAEERAMSSVRTTL
jgi:hypothetical protein